MITFQAFKEPVSPIFRALEACRIPFGSEEMQRCAGCAPRIPVLEPDSGQVRSRKLKSLKTLEHRSSPSS